MHEGIDAHLPKGSLSNDPVEIKVVQVNFAFKVYRGGETAAHISSIAGGEGGGGAVKGGEGDKEHTGC